MIIDHQTEAFSRDGVVFVPGACGLEWVENLRQGIEDTIESPSERGRINRKPVGCACAPFASLRPVAEVL